MTYGKFGEDSPTESVWRPLDTSRSQTDSKFTFAFAILFCTWISTGVYAILAGDKDYILLNKHVVGHLTFDIYPTIHFIYQNFDDSKYYILVSTLISSAILFICICMFRWTNKFLVGVAMLLLLALITILYAGAIGDLIQRSSFTWLIGTIILSVFYILALFSFIIIGLTAVCKHLRQSWKAMFFFPSATFLMAAVILQQILLFAFAVAVHAFLQTVDLPDVEDDMVVSDYDDSILNEHLGNVPRYCIYFLQLINFVGYFWTSFFLMAFGQTVLTAAFAAWYHVEDKNRIPLTTLPKCFMTTLKYHTGTIALSASPLSIILVLYVIYEQGVDKLKGVSKRPFYLLFWLFAMIKLPFDALVHSAIYGKNFYESVKYSYILIMKNPIAFLAIDTLSDIIICFGTLIATFLSCFGSFLCIEFVHNPTGDKRTTTMQVINIFSFLMSLILFTVFRTASSTIRFCYLEDSTFCEASAMDLDPLPNDDKNKDINCEPNKSVLVCE